MSLLGVSRTFKLSIDKWSKLIRGVSRDCQNQGDLWFRSQINHPHVLQDNGPSEYNDRFFSEFLTY